MSQTRIEPDSGPVYRTPRWVKALGIIALVIVLVVAIVLVTGLGGEHGPGRHLPSSAGSDTTTNAQETQHNAPVGHTAPIEHSTQQP